MYSTSHIYSQIVMLNHHVKGFAMTFLASSIDEAIVCGDIICNVMWKVGINVTEHGDCFQCIVFSATS